MTNTNINNTNTFLSKLQTLKSFIDGMGIKASDDVLSDVLKKSGYNVELALERILAGNGSISTNDGTPTHNNSLATSTKKRDSSSTGNATASSKKRSSTGSSSSSLSTSSKMPKSRHSFGGAPSLKDNTHTVQQQPTNRLLLCKRWTIASSRSTRGRVSYGEVLDFSQNWNNNHETKGSKLINPLVRFRSNSGYVEGTLNRYLCSILVPLLNLPATNHDNNNDQFIPLVSIEGETLMEDRSIVIGSEIPLTLKVYINDPISFFELFSSGKDGIEKSNAASSAKLFFQNSAKKKSPTLYQGKKAKSSFSDEELAEAAFHLLQWADKGEELPFKRKEETKEKLKEDTTTLDLEVAESNSTLENGDGDYEDTTSLASEQVDELNQLVVSDEQEGKLKTSLPELLDPSGFKKDIGLHMYQREALHWMCRREGVHIKGEMDNNSLEDDTGELDLLAELVSLSASDNSDPSIQDKAVSCDCGAVVVSNELLESGEIVPVAEYGQKERKEEKTNNYHHHPLWKRQYLATYNLTSVYSFYVNELLGIASASPPDPPKQCNGGILADAMGLGKTIMLLALILKTKESISSTKKRPSDSSLKPERASKKAASSGADGEEFVDLSSDIESDNDDDESYTDDDHNIQMLKRNNSGTTLVIAPLSLVSQWEEELATKTDLSHLMYYENKKATGCDVFSSCDVVVTTYGTVQSEYACWTRSAMKQPGQSHPLLAFDWKRIILDEAHGIKNPSTIVSKACCMLKAESRWCVTGTPIQNSLQDVYGLLKFLRHEPWSDAGFWRKAITDAATTSTETSTKRDEGVQEATSAAFNRVRRVLSPIILRRTKDTLSEDGTPILKLPPIDNAIVTIQLSPAEREFYNALLERSQSVFEGLIQNGTVSKSWFALFSLLQRLRQACDHVSLTVSKRLETSEVARLKSGTEPTSKGAGSGEDGVDDKFLGSLLKMFKKKKSKADTQSSFVKQVAESLTQTVQSTDECLKNECPICLEEPRVEDAIHTPCAHSFHRECLLAEFHEQVVRSNKKQVELNKKSSTSSQQPKVEGGSCPVCHEYVKISQLIQIKRNDNGETISKYLNQESKIEKENAPNTDAQRDVVAREALESALSGASSSKLQAIMDELDNVWTLEPFSKVLIFSQFLGFLDIIGNALKDIGVQTFRIDGSLSLKERVKMIAKFNKYKSAKSDSSDNSQRGCVFLVSMKAGGVGLNLVSASSVFIIDPWWNQAIEDQCINRVHRIGQQAKVVRVRKFIVADSVEEKIVSLQGKKKGMANTILDGDGLFDSTKPSLDDFKLLFGQ